MAKGHRMIKGVRQVKNEWINKLQGQGIKVEKTKSRHDLFQVVFGRGPSFSVYDSTGGPKKKVGWANN